MSEDGAQRSSIQWTHAGWPTPGRSRLVCDGPRGLLLCARRRWTLRDSEVGYAETPGHSAPIGPLIDGLYAVVVSCVGCGTGDVETYGAKNLPVIAGCSAVAVAVAPPDLPDLRGRRTCRPREPTWALLRVQVRGTPSVEWSAEQSEAPFRLP